MVDVDRSFEGLRYFLVVADWVLIWAGNRHLGSSSALSLSAVHCSGAISSKPGTCLGTWGVAKLKGLASTILGTCAVYTVP